MFTPEEARGFWNNKFPETPPVSNRFRDIYADRWIRIHSLPESKRYADTDQELKEVLRRYDCVLTDLVGGGNEVLIIFCSYDADKDRSSCRSIREINFSLFESIRKQSFDPDDEDEGLELQCFYALDLFESHKFDEVFTCVANNVIRNVFLVAIQSGRIFAPYDGGADIIVENRGSHDEYRERFREWLSARPDGL